MERKDTKLGLVMGSNKVKIDKLDAFKGQKITTKFGPIFLWVGEKSILLPRHGKDNNIPPHMINHRANIFAFQKLGVEKIVSFTSVGSLKHDLKPTYLIMPDDYINMGSINTYFDNKIIHIVPGMDDDLREEIFSKIQGIGVTIRYNGTYIQTQGPRLETKAEIQMLKKFGDVVGMTMANEATLAKELNIGYANISVVDNYCHGLIDEPLTVDVIRDNQIKSAANIETIIKKLISE